MATDTLYVFKDRSFSIKVSTVKPAPELGYTRIVVTKHGDLRVFNEDGDEFDPSTGRELRK